MKEVPVVTAFLQHANQICLFRRSQRVGTYRGHYAGISGYLEGSPEGHVHVEIAEETGLAPHEYRLLRRARPLIVPDEGLDRRWVVHAFLCEVFDPGRIELDWEHVEHVWIDPPRMQDLPCVPGLWAAYEGVSRIPLERALVSFAASLIEDRRSGSRQLTLKTLDFMLDLCRTSNAACGDVLLEDLALACEALTEVRPSMAMIATTLAYIMQEARTSTAEDLETVRAGLNSLIERHLRDIRTALPRAASHLRALLPEGGRVLVHSYSSSLEEAFAVLREKGCHLVATESRPGLEGRFTAGRAAEAGLPVKLVTDAAAAQELGAADLVLMGVDAIESDGSVINKVGSALIALAARELGVKVYFLGETRKIAPPGARVVLEEQPPGLVWEDPPAPVAVSNITFDRTPPRCITGIVLETGVVEPDQIRAMAASGPGHMA